MILLLILLPKYYAYNFSLCAISILHHHPTRLSYGIYRDNNALKMKRNSTNGQSNSVGPDPIGVCVYIYIYINRQVFPIIKEIYGGSTGRPKRFAKTRTNIHIYVCVHRHSHVQAAREYKGMMRCCAKQLARRVRSPEKSWAETKSLQ